MPVVTSRKYLFATIYRATLWVYMEIRSNKSTRSAEGFLEYLIKAVPFVISKILTDNGKEFTGRFCATGQREPIGNHLFDKVCAIHGVEHR